MVLFLDCLGKYLQQGLLLSTSFRTGRLNSFLKITRTASYIQKLTFFFSWAPSRQILLPFGYKISCKCTMNTETQLQWNQTVCAFRVQVQCTKPQWSRYPTANCGSTEFQYWSGKGVIDKKAIHFVALWINNFYGILVSLVKWRYFKGANCHSDVDLLCSLCKNWV